MQSLCTQISSLAAHLTNVVNHDTLGRVCESSERTFKALTNEALDPEFVPIIEKKKAP